MDHIITGAVKGAAIATAISQEILGEILKVGIPTLMFQLLTSLSMAMTNDAANVCGNSALAVMGPVTKIMSIRNLIVSMQRSALPFFGQRFSASCSG